MDLLSLCGTRRSHLTLHDVTIMGCWGAALAIVELSGRASTNDLTDALSLAVLFSLFTLTPSSRWLRSWMPKTRVWKRYLSPQALFDLWSITTGVDLRGTPPVPSEFPARWRRVLLCLAALTLVLTAVGPIFPHTSRDFLASHAYLVNLLLLVSTWTAALACSVFMAFIGWAAIHDQFVHAYRGPGKRSLRPEVWTNCLVAGGLLLLAATVPVWIPVCGLAVLLALLGLTLAGARPGLNFIWRGSHRSPRRIDGRLYLWTHAALIILPLLCLCLLLLGDRILLPAHQIPSRSLMPLSYFIGELLAWSALFGFTMLTWDGWKFSRASRRLSLEFPPPLSVALTTAVTPDVRRSWQQALAKHGWQWRDAQHHASRTDIHLDPAEFSPASLADPETADRVVRRGEIQARRALIRGLQMLFKFMARKRWPRGRGCWIGLQHWFIRGLVRDEDGDPRLDRDSTILSNIIGPPYDQVLPTRARYHFLQITRALEIDLIFVEDGISFKRLTRVLRVLFEIYDKHAGRQRAEERHFHGLPGTRVVLHDFHMEVTPSHRLHNYPEPDYDDVGRARILHIFKDRGEEEADLETPFDFEDQPLYSESY